MSSASDRRPYVVPRYRAAADTAFYHVLHGTVPGHQIDYLYCPEVPQGALRQTHFGHLSRLIKYIEPRAGAEYAFALGNLSRDDTQHEPGSGGVALLFALRVPGVTDHAGRDTPPYAHGLVAVGRALDRAALFDAATAFYRRFLERDGARDRRGDFYREYVRTVEERPDDVEPFLSRSIAAIDDLPCPGPSSFSWDIEADEAAPARRIVIVHDDGAPFERIAYGAAALGAMLYRSNIKWTSLSTGRALDIPGGTTVRFVPESEAASEEGALTLHIDDLPDDEGSLADLLFGARLRADRSPVSTAQWQNTSSNETAPAPSPAESASAARPVPEFAQTVTDPAATCPAPESAQTVLDLAQACPAPEVVQIVIDEEACFASESAQSAIDSAATRPAPDVTQTALEPAATCPMAPLESALDPPESAVRPRIEPAPAALRPVASASDEPAPDVVRETAPRTPHEATPAPDAVYETAATASHEATPASGGPRETVSPPRPRMRPFLLCVTAIAGVAAALFATSRMSSPAPPSANPADGLHSAPDPRSAGTASTSSTPATAPRPNAATTVSAAPIAPASTATTPATPRTEGRQTAPVRTQTAKKTQRVYAGAPCVFCKEE